MSSISVSPQTATVAAGLTQNFTATGTFSDGSSRPLAGVTWTSSDTTSAKIDSAGKATTLKQGTVTITAGFSGVNGTATLNIGPPVATGMALSPPNATVYIGAAAPKFSALMQYSDGSSIDVSSTASWSVSNTFIAAVDTTGNTTIQRTGLTRIQASAQGFAGAGELTVISVPRYMYATSDASRIISRMTIEPQNGSLRYKGYQTTNANNYAAFGCLTTDPSQSFAYVGALVNSPQAGNSLGEVQIYRIDGSSGDLAPSSGSPFPVTAPIGCIEFEPTGKFGYATASLNNTNNQLVTFSRNAATGALTMLGSIPLAGPPSGLTIDPRGEFLYAATYYLGTGTPALAYGFRINATTGELTPIQGTPFLLSSAAGSFSFDPAGAYVYMANTNGNSIDVYALDRMTGKLSAQGGSVSPCINPSELRFSPDGRSAFVTCTMNNSHGPNSASLVSFSVGSNGQLTLLGSAAIGDAPSELTMNPDGKFVYAFSLADSNYYTYQIGGDGKATWLRKSGARGFGSLAIVGGTAGVVYDTKYAYAISKADNTLATYAVNGDGTWTQKPTQATQMSPVSLSMLPWGTELLAGSSSPSPNITPFTVDRTTGAAAPGFIFGEADSLGSALIDPSGKWAFASDSANGTITTYVNSGNLWSPLSYVSSSGPNYSTFAAGPGAGPMAIDPSGQYLYVANRTGSSISAFRYFGTSPQLLEATTQFTAPFTDGSPYALPAAPIALAIDPTGAFLYVVSADNSLRVYQVDYYSWGHLKLVTTKTLASTPTGVAASARSSIVYVSTGSGIEGFSVNPQTGAVTSISLGSAGNLANVTGMYTEPSGRWLYATTGSALYGFEVAADGTITQTAGGAVATLNQTTSVTFATDIN